MTRDRTSIALKIADPGDNRTNLVPPLSASAVPFGRSGGVFIEPDRHDHAYRSDHRHEGPMLFFGALDAMHTPHYV